MKTVLVLLNKWSENIEQEVCKYEGMSGNYKVKVLQNYRQYPTYPMPYARMSTLRNPSNKKGTFINLHLSLSP